MSKVSKMIKENYTNSQKLSEENLEIYTDMVCYIRTSSIENITQEEIISDILDIILRNQQRGKPLSEVIGIDYKAFCDSIIESVGVKRFTISGIADFIKIFINTLFVMLTVDFIFNFAPTLIKGEKLAKVYSIDISLLLISMIIVIIAYCIVLYIGKNSFKLSERKRSKKENFLFGASSGLLVIILAVIWIMASKYLICPINTILIIIALGVFWIYKVIIKKILKL